MNNQIGYTFNLLWPFLFSIASCFAQDKEDERMQQVVYRSLVHFHHCKVLGCEASDPYPNSLPPIRKWYSEASKNELLKLLENKWSDQEKRELAEKSVRKYLEIEIGNLTKSKDNPDILPRHKKVLQKRLDSLMKVTKIKIDTFPSYQSAIEKRMRGFEELKLDDQLIRIAGLLDDMRYTPVLKKAIGDSIHYGQLITKLALARLGQENYYREMLHQYSVDDNFIKKNKKNHNVLYEYYSSKSGGLIYLCTQESIKELGKFLNAGKGIPIKLDSDVLMYPTYKTAAVEIINKIKNDDFVNYFRKELPNDRGYMESVLKDEHITFLQKWLRENYGRYELVRD
jgi:hypothetical protein